MNDSLPQPTPQVPDDTTGLVDGDAGTYLEAFVFGAPIKDDGAAPVGGIPIELVGQHLRLSGSVQIGLHRRLTDFVNNHEGLIRLFGATVLRRNGDPTKVTAPSIWVSPAEVTLIGESIATSAGDRSPEFVRSKRPFTLIVVTPGHTLTGEVHLSPEAMLSGFIESPSPPWIPMTDVRTRSLADRRVTSRYAFALLNRRHIVAATELQPGVIRGRSVL